MPPAKVLCLTTGGSLDKTYDGVVLLCHSRSADGEALPEKCAMRARCGVRRDLSQGLAWLTKGDREVLDAAVRAAPQQYIVITHGTDTLNVTAKALQRTAVATGKTVVLTGP